MVKIVGKHKISKRNHKSLILRNIKNYMKKGFSKVLPESPACPMEQEKPFMVGTCLLMGGRCEYCPKSAFRTQPGGAAGPTFRRGPV